MYFQFIYGNELKVYNCFFSKWESDNKYTNILKLCHYQLTI